MSKRQRDLKAHDVFKSEKSNVVWWGLGGEGQHGTEIKKHKT